MGKLNYLSIAAILVIVTINPVLLGEEGIVRISSTMSIVTIKGLFKAQKHELVEAAFDEELSAGVGVACFPVTEKPDTFVRVVYSLANETCLGMSLLLLPVPKYDSKLSRITRAIQWIEFSSDGGYAVRFTPVPK